MFIDHRYEVLESLGTGTWANVYKVKDIRTGNLYTLKLFQYLSSSELYSHFSAEDMHHISRIEHPNLSHVEDYGHVGDHIYYISDYFDGNPLSSFRFSKTKIDTLYDIVVQICYALNALHTQNILHRDLKPENILYHSQNGELKVKLIDYGFSKVDIGKDSKLVSGTLPYIAPEVYLGKSVGFPSDFYSLGVILYRLVTGSYPFNLEQITALMSGSQQYFIPVFPSELNKAIPLNLEKLILRLLERNPENRFQSSEEIISYINRSANKDYEFSVSWSMVNALRFNSYIVRESYSHQLLDHLPSVQSNNGKIISLIGGEGLGKDNILSLFRYHLLGGQYFIFDYSCTRTEHEAFFALIKEFLQSLPPDEVGKFNSLNQISDKFRSYLFDSEQEAKSFTQTAEELKSDFESAKSLLLDLCERKPVIFIIRNFQYVHRHTIDFINFLSPHIVQHRILVLLGCNDFNKVKQVEHTILVHIPMLKLDESREYMMRLLKSKVPEGFCLDIHQRSAGNPHFIREILIDLTLRKKLVFGPEISFPASLSEYALPSRLTHSVYSRMSHLTAENYAYLQKISVVRTPISRELMLYILKIKDSELYGLLNESIYNEIFEKRGKLYHFTFPEAQERFFSECSAKMQVLVSKRVIKYFKNKPVNDATTCRGIIQNAGIGNEPLQQREYLLRLYQLLSDDYEQEQAYGAILNVLKIDLDPALEIGRKELIEDLNAFQEKTEITGFFRTAGFIMDSVSRIPEIFEKYLVLGTLELLAENLKEALKHLQKAESLALTGRQRILSYLYLIQIYTRVDKDKMKLYLDKASSTEMPLDLKIAWVDRLAVYHSLNKDTDRAIRIIEDFLISLPPHQDQRIMIRLAAIHNDLGVFYSDQKNISEADEHLGIALGIWKRHNIKRYLGLIYNNISDLYLKQGITVRSEQYSRVGYHYAKELDLTLTQALALLNQGEAKIKMGEYEEAEEKLLEAKELILSVKSTKFLDSIERNLALAKSKIIGFGHYFKFIQTSEPKLIEGFIDQINPLVKTYFYYLNEMCNPKKLRRLISKNVHINYQHIHEEEFYHNVLSLLAITEKDYETALMELKQAMRYAGEINNNYAIAVFYVLEILCHYGLRDYAKAGELIGLAKPIIEEHKYRYWDTKLDIMNLKLDLVNAEIPLRQILRKANDLLNRCDDYKYYQLKVELLQIKLQLLAEMGAEARVEEEFKRYREYLLEITENIAKDDRQNYLNVNYFNLKNLKKLELLPAQSRRKDLRSKWNELLFNIANVNSVQRIKFLIEKGISQVISPWQFKLMVYSDKISNYYTFQCFNCPQDSFIPPEFMPQIKRALEADMVIQFQHQGRNIVVIPMVSGNKRIGYLLLSDNGEMEFGSREMSIIRNIKAHLTALIIRTWDYTEITMRMEKMNQLMEISHELMRIVDMGELEREIVSIAIDFANATRGFLIKRDAEGNNLYQVQMDHNKQLLSTVTGISKTALSLCQQNLEPVITYNAAQDNRFKNSVSVQDYAIHTIFCSPILVDSTPVGFLYLDNLGDNTRELYLNEEIVRLLVSQISIAIKNARQYESILLKSSELNAFEQLKDEFMAIVAHELNTPLTSLQGYVSRLKRNLYADEDERVEIISKTEAAVKKLILSINDITTMNQYNLTKSLPMAPIDISEILDLVHQEIMILSRKRRMQIKMEVEKDLPPVKANWEALHRMVHNIVLNAIRFTNDFGNVLIGARRSAFPQEKIDNKETLVIFVQDNGIGIPQYQLKNIFRKFYELNEIYAHKSGIIEYRSSGLGLGLATSRRIAELHSGDIIIKSKENEGTQVFIIIPFK
jgi:serine/threonine protein kinase/signal transduction histidine kinase